MTFNSKLGRGNIDIQSTPNEVKLLSGFNSIAEQIHILTHPVIGYYHIKNKKIGTYQIWHPLMKLHMGKSNTLYFELFEKLGFLSKEDMLNPHSVLMTPDIEFDILLPPKPFKAAP
ncbi:MAG: hypothetical protein ACWA41_06375 [Putridiphycobacter sp.]